jgi:hypothetical protein
MTQAHYEQLYSVLRGPIRCADDKTELLFDVMAMEELEQLRPILWDIEAQAEARARFKHLLELAWALKQASSSYAEVTHDLGCGKLKERGLLAK